MTIATQEDFVTAVNCIKDMLDSLTGAHSDFVKEINEHGRPLTEREIEILEYRQRQQEQ